MDSKQPLVSIIIPVYNGSNYLREAIDSALAQTYQNIEIIVVNDGSNDKGKTDRIAKSYGDKIRYFKKENGGVSSAINLGIKKMKGEYFSWLSHDDVYLPNKIFDEITFLTQKKLLHKKVIVFSDYQVIDKKGKLLFQPIINPKLVEKNHLYALIRGAINGNTLLIPKKAWNDYGLLNEKFICTQDYEKWFEMSKTYKFILLPKALIKSRYHTKQASHADPNVKNEGNAFWLKIIKSFDEDARLKLNNSNYAFFYYFREYLKHTPYDQALSYCEQQLKKYPPKKIPEENFISYKNNIQPFSNNKIIRLFQIFHREGIANTLKRIYKKLK